MILLTRSLFTQMALDQTGRRGCGGQPGAFRQCPHYPMDCLGKRRRLYLQSSLNNGLDQIRRVVELVAPLLFALRVASRIAGRAICQICQ